MKLMYFLIESLPFVEISKYTGIAGISLLILFYLFKNIINKLNWPRQNRENAFKTIKLLINWVGVITIISIITYAIIKPKNNEVKKETVEYRVTKIKVLNDSIITKMSFYSNEHLNDHCQGTTPISWKVKASEGWFINQDSINIVSRSERDGCNIGTITDKNKNGFIIEGSVQNRGSCIGPSKDARGKVSIGVEYIEYQLIPVEKEVDSKNRYGMISSNGIAEIFLEKNTSYYEIELYSNKDTILLSKNKLNESSFLIIEDLENNKITLRSF